MAEAARSAYELASEAAGRLGITLSADEPATLASDRDMGEPEIAAAAAIIARPCTSMSMVSPNVSTGTSVAPYSSARAA